jgi:hypothetical protein
MSRILTISDVGVFSSNPNVTHFLQVKEYDLAFFPLTKKGAGVW